MFFFSKELRSSWVHRNNFYSGKACNYALTN